MLVTLACAVCFTVSAATSQEGACEFVESSRSAGLLQSGTVRDSDHAQPKKRFSGLSLADQKEVEKLMHATNNDTNFEECCQKISKWWCTCTRANEIPADCDPAYAESIAECKTKYSSSEECKAPPGYPIS
ncbi:hypothetical protein AK812_SmicGene27322 [Symbiodinium microadriaticum]|uniref:Uncharacterized protein n=1 Tax=Symbiodinium microadriaticum TaxID=2951 RepID=A0A1Q9D766_SYMMI|nr:hypothetical protein AK812_SmicGene27322 [Symbiodinium microadriaticum]CAE7897197.1 unnamed protein product [Symbiodinium microadriaticum]CAE7947891.1 unnamed protein product [Symbiodinium sp. KB8]